jgi:acetylcholinesterase
LYPNIPSLGVPYGQFDNQTIPDAGLEWRRAASIIGDILVIAPERFTAQILNSSQTEPLYKFMFNGTYDSGFPSFFGATHGIELAFVFNDPDLLNTTARSNLGILMSRSWASFVSDLNPNHHGLKGVPNWDVYSSTQQGVYFNFQMDLPISLEPDIYRQEGIELINQAKLTLNMA